MFFLFIALFIEAKRFCHFFVEYKYIHFSPKKNKVISCLNDKIFISMFDFEVGKQKYYYEKVELKYIFTVK